MHKPILFICFLAFCVTSQVNGQFLDTVRIQQTGLDGTVPVSTDDAEQINAEIDKLFDDDLDMGWEGDEFNVVSTGLRFRGVNVPKNARIDSAYIEIWAHEDEGDLAKLTIYAEASDNPVTYDEVNLISTRPRTNAFVYWECDEEWTMWQQYRTPELKTLVQEVVNRSGWAAGNAMAFFLNGEDQGASDDDNARDFASFENIEDPDDGGDGLNHPERIPKLFIYYSDPSSVRNLATANNLKVSPNPVSAGTNVNLGLHDFVGQTLNITLTDMNGAALQNWTIRQLDNADLSLTTQAPAGIYMLKVQSETHIGVLKLAIF
jgi:hypothetical protein